jgi:signal transduction histidine kinase
VIADGEHRFVALQALRRASDDRALQLRFRVGRDLWVDEKGAVAARGSMVIARREDGDAAVEVIPSDEISAIRLATQGDCSTLLAPAIFEAQLAHQSQRADLAAETERRRLQRNLHDGLQGRLLGLALGLQLSGRSLDDPSARLLVTETVGALRTLVDDVRTLGGGDLPAILQADGLEVALRALLAPIGSIVSLDISEPRFDRSFEEIAYFVVGEAVTNALKHADAQKIRVRISPDTNDVITITVHDDGCGGADPRAGTGLRSLAERVTASGGTFLVRDDFERGTVVEAVLPCGL